MNRAERRRAAREEGKQNKLYMSRQNNKQTKYGLTMDQIELVKKEVMDELSEYYITALMTCFALSEHRLYGHGKKRIYRSLEYVEDLMTSVMKGDTTVDEYKKQLEEETGVRITLE